jgi:glycosyltransferase involved in cell wall biosynthesis
LKIDKDITILIRGGISTYTGYGSALCSLASELTNYLDVALWGVDVSMGLPRDITAILEKPIPQRAEIFLDFVTPFNAKGGYKNIYSILYSMVEQTGFTKNVILKDLKSYHKIITTNYVAKEVFEKALDRNDVIVIPLGIDPNFWKYKPRKIGKKIRFCTTGYMNKRKGIDLAVEAYKQIRQNYDCSLDIWNVNNEPMPKKWLEIPDLKIIEHPTLKAELREFYYNHDVLLATSRGEGFNMVGVEFLSTGGSVIGTTWAGHEMWLHENFAYPVRYNMVEVTAISDIFPTTMQFIDENWLVKGNMWAEPVLDDIIDNMSRICENKDELESKMENTYIIRREFDIRKIAKHFLHEILKK